MKRVIHNLVQGSPAWQAFRLDHHGASEAAAMLGLSLTTTRNELLRMKHLRMPKEFSDWVQANVLDHGHEVEALARPFAEMEIGEDLSPVTYSYGVLSASCDGLTVFGDVTWEHKQWSERLAELMRAGTMPPEHMPQVQQAMLVTGAKRCLFTVSDGTPQRMLHLWVDADPEWHRRLIDGWAQFDRDLAAYSPAPAAAPAPIGKAPETLPALLVNVTGQVLASNLPEFKATALGAIRSINRTLKTDQDFADARKSVKWCEDVEARLKASKEHALAQTVDLATLFTTMDEIAKEAREVRLEIDKLITKRSTEVKQEAVGEATAAFISHVKALNAEIAPAALRPISADFAGAIKGLRSIESMQNALDTLLANKKIEADNAARAIRENQATFKAKAAGFEFLFADVAQLVHKPADDFALLINTRIKAHEEAEAEKKRKADEAAQASLAAAAAPAPAPAPVPEAAPAVITRSVQTPTYVRTGPPPAAPVDPDEPATLNVGAINGRLGFTMTSDFIADTLGVKPHVDGRARMFTEGQYRRICIALVAHIAKAQELQVA